MPNRLAGETSPYLLQHKDNPVDWHPWGEVALARAREEDKPILLSIGYSACHWCHVMERESFEDAETARLMNELFVCIKLDREERPDLDSIYMEACQAMTGAGGWPLNAFLTPEHVPFYAGTYFPPQPRMGMPSWRQVLEAVAHAWQEKREEIRAGGSRIAERLRGGALLEPSSEPLQEAALDTAVEGLRAAYDPANGGFGSAPKFPPASALEFLLRRGEGGSTGVGPVRTEAFEMTSHTLRAMASGGMYDQVGGGFSRYSVDAYWLVPHFEKMLYDNALLARAYLHGWQVTGDELFRTVAVETLDWALREMRAPEGGFFSALDADSEGVEGKFYVWTVEEMRAALGEAPDADEAIAWFGATDRGNFEGRNIPVRGPGVPERLDEWRRPLYEARAKRVWPGLDDKRLTSWNALMISALAEAGAVLERPDYLDAARGCADFLLGSLRDDDGRLLRTWKDGEARLNAYLEDHGYLLEALLTLYESTFEPRWFAEARALADTMIERFADEDNGGFFETSSDHERPAGPPQGPRGSPDPVRQRERRVRAPAPGGAERRALLRGARGLRAAAAPRAGGEAPAGVRTPAAGDGLPPLAGEGGGARGRRPASSRAGCARRVPPPHRGRRRRPRRRAAPSGPPAGGRPRGRLCVRAVCLQGAGDGAAGARAAALLAIAG